MSDNKESVRIDKWLNAARFYKTRSQARKGSKGGKGKINGNTDKPHNHVKHGDKLTVHRHDQYRNVEVIGLAEKGLPAKKAVKLYNEEKPKERMAEEDLEMLKILKKSVKPNKRKFKGRPTKKERRQMEKAREKFQKGGL